MKRIDLTRMKSGEEGVIVEITPSCGWLKRLEVLGIREGVRIKKVSPHLLRGPVVIQVGNTQVALGFGMAKKIFIGKKR